MKKQLVIRTVVAGCVALALPVSGAETAPAKGAKPAPKVKTYPDYPNLARLNIGDPAPTFTLPGVDGLTHTLAEYKQADVLAVLFTCNHCPTSQMYEDRVIALVKRYAGKSFQLVAISPNDPGALRPDEVAGAPLGDSFAEMKIRAAEKKFPFPYLYDGRKQKVSMSYGATVTPQIFVFDKDRKLRYTGAIDENPYGTRGTSYALNAVDALLAGEKIPVAVTRPFGCSVKWGYKRQAVDEAAAAWNAKPVTLADLDAAGAKTLVANEGNFLRVICVWSLDDPSCKSGLADLIHLRRIFEFRPVELMTVNCDPAARRADVLALLKTHHAAAPGDSRWRPPQVKQPPCNYFSTMDKAKLLAAVGKAKTPRAPRTVILMPGGEVILTQEGKLDVGALRKRIAEVFGGGR